MSSLCQWPAIDLLDGEGNCPADGPSGSRVVDVALLPLGACQKAQDKLLGLSSCHQAPPDYEKRPQQAAWQARAEYRCRSAHMLHTRTLTLLRSRVF